MIKLTEAEAHAVYGVLVKELEAVPQGEEMFVDCCRDGDAEQITFLGSRSEKSWAGSTGRRLNVETARFSVVSTGHCGLSAQKMLSQHHRSGPRPTPARALLRYWPSFRRPLCLRRRFARPCVSA